jgi:hypothetical protein
MDEAAILVILNALWMIANDAYPATTGEDLIILRTASVADSWDDIDATGEPTEAITAKMTELFDMGNVWSTYRDEVDVHVAELMQAQYVAETYSVIRDAWVNSTNSVESIEPEA